MKVSALFGCRAPNDLSGMEIAVATAISRQDGSCTYDAVAEISDICGRKVGMNEVNSVLARLVAGRFITSEGRIEMRRLTIEGVAALNEAQKVWLRSFDRGPALVVFGEMINLFDWWAQERNHD